MMSKVCIPQTQGGKGNRGLFIERDSKIYAAGKPTPQGLENIGDHLQHYLLQDKVDALIHDAIIPLQESPRRQLKGVDMRNAGPFTEARDLINPPVKTKFQTLVLELKNATYSSFWKKPLGKTRDHLPMLPAGTNITTKTMGIKTKKCGNLYDLVLPKKCGPDNTVPLKLGCQTDRKYCRPAFGDGPDRTYGMKYKPDLWGGYVKCCLSDSKTHGTTSRYTRIPSLDADMKELKHPKLGVCKSPNNNIDCVPPGYAFGKLKPPDNFSGCLTNCEINSGRTFFLECLAHLNTVRKFLSNRFDTHFFRYFYLNLKYLDEDKSGWLPKEIVYDKCAARFVRFKPNLIEPLLEMWGAFDGSRIEYKKFIHIINYREPSPKLPKILDVKPECLQFTTTYKDMVEPEQPVDNRLMAGVPSGRYLDKPYPVTPEGYCKAHRICLPQESDARSCMNPSVLTLLGVNHRDMYAKRSYELIKNVFDRAGVDLSDEEFNEIWEEAKKYHSQGLVCFETFKRAFDEIYVDKV